jgi:hypothetical protein
MACSSLILSERLRPSNSPTRDVRDLPLTSGRGSLRACDQGNAYLCAGGIACAERNRTSCFTWISPPFATAQFSASLPPNRLTMSRSTLRSWTPVEELPRSTLAAIQLASCIGGRFDLGTLALIAGEHSEGARDLIRPAVDAGLVIPDRDGSLKDPGETSIGRGRFRFLHDRVQQAAHAMLDEPTRIAAHLQIGQRLRASIPDLAGSDRLFEVVEHLNAGVELITDDVSRGELAALNLVAARRALAATAPVAADAYAAKGLSCLPADRWQSSYEWTRDLLRARVDAAYLRGDFEFAAHDHGDAHPVADPG